MKTIKTFYPIREVDGNNPFHAFASCIPNYLGINLCSVEGIEEKRQEDGQLVSVTIKFIPNNE